METRYARIKSLDATKEFGLTQGFDIEQSNHEIYKELVKGEVYGIVLAHQEEDELSFVEVATVNQGQVPLIASDVECVSLEEFLEKGQSLEDAEFVAGSIVNVESLDATEEELGFDDEGFIESLLGQNIKILGVVELEHPLKAILDIPDQRAVAVEYEDEAKFLSVNDLKLITS